MLACVEHLWCDAEDTEPDSSVLIGVANVHTVSDKRRCHDRKGVNSILRAESAEVFGPFGVPEAPVSDCFPNQIPLRIPPAVGWHRQHDRSLT
jgi:hypothetical protein